MADPQDSGQEKTESPTQKRIEDSRKKGQVARSKELNTLFILMTGILGLLWTMPNVLGQFEAISAMSFTPSREEIFDAQFLIEAVFVAIEKILFIVLPILLMIFIGTILSSLLLGGWNLSAEAMAFKFDRLDPIQGFKRLISWNGIAELIKSLAKFLLIATVATTLLWFVKFDLLELGTMTFTKAMKAGLSIVLWIALAVTSSLIIVALLDIPFQLWQHNKKLKMTKQEIKDELKETEGRPEVRSRIRKLQQETSQRRMMSEVPTADVILTNPSHFAVALRYDKLASGAPKVVAKGTDLVAQKICEIAEGSEVPIYSSPPLTRAIYYSTELDREIPAGLYMAVAQILAYVYQLKSFKKGLSPRPDKPKKDLPIPEALQR